MYTLPHLVLGVFYLFLGALGGSFALKTLMALHKSPEMWRSQRGIWLPILIGMVFFAIGGVIHFGEHSFWMAPEADLLHEIVIVMGFSLFTVGVLRYSYLQLEYYRLKCEAIGKIQLPEPIQPEQVVTHPLDYLTDVTRAFSGKTLSTTSLEQLCKAQAIADYTSENSDLITDPKKMAALRSMLLQ